MATVYPLPPGNEAAYWVEELHGHFGREVSLFYGQSRRPKSPYHEHDYAQLILTYGRGPVEVVWQNSEGARGRQILGSHTFCLIPPRSAHSCRWSPEADVVFLYLEPAAFSEHIKITFNEVVIADFRALSRTDGLLWPLAQELRRISQQTPAPTAAFVDSVGMALAALTLERHFAQSQIEEVESCLPSNALEKISAYIDTHMKDELTPRLLAKQVGLSALHFARLFKRTTGLPPTQYIAKMRVQKALELLRTGEYRIADVAYEVGFYDQSHLDRHCKKFFGFPPKVILRRAQKSS